MIITFWSHDCHMTWLCILSDSCMFEGTHEDLAEHLEQCKFEGLKVSIAWGMFRLASIADRMHFNFTGIPQSDR